VSGSIDVIDDGENGILVEPGQPEELAEAIETLLREPERRASLGTAARQTIEAEYTWDALAGTFLELYREASVQ
jgi:glycosyltransferase involved in cell wall biosynthesis